MDRVWNRSSSSEGLRDDIVGKVLSVTTRDGFPYFRESTELNTSFSVVLFFCLLLF